MSESYTFDNLLAGDLKLVTNTATVLTGNNLTRGTVLGKVTLGTVSKAAKGGGNTGNGTLVLDVTTPKLAKAKLGVYTVRVIKAYIAAYATTPAVSAQLGLAELRDPDGNVVATFEIDASTGTTVSNHVKFVMTDGATKFVVGDGFDITIAAGSGKVVAVDSTNVDGSQYPIGVLAEDTDATSADKVGTYYMTGEFNEGSLVFGGTDVIANHRDALRALGIFTKTIQA